MLMIFFLIMYFTFSRTAGLPQYGQLGHGSDNEVGSREQSSYVYSYSVIFSLFNLSTLSGDACTL